MTSHEPDGNKRIAIIGAGSWGTALAMVAARKGHDVRLWARESEVAAGIQATGKNPYYLSEFELPRNIKATTTKLCNKFRTVRAASNRVEMLPPLRAGY